MKDKEFEPIIGLEIHVELKTKSKMFCGCSADYFSHKPNTHCCPVCLGLPGALPVPNKKAVEWCIKLGLALNCKIPLFSKFDRKNYFYPDLPKGYQISQYDRPFCVNGWLDIKSQIPNSKRIRIRRVHMEEDTGKLIHANINGKKCTLIDFNRSGIPLVEIVTEPDIQNSEDAKIFLKQLYQIIRYLDISDADMEKGSMRLEPNISVRVKSQKFLRLPFSQIQDKRSGQAKIKSNNELLDNNDLPNYKVEVKNINSFNFVKKAIDFEINRQLEILVNGGVPKQETRGWDDKKNITYPQRSKEEAHDYRYFPEPDIPPVRWTTNQILNIKDQIPELPYKKIDRFIRNFQISQYDAMILTDDIKTANYFEECVILINRFGKKSEISPKIIANNIINKKVNINKNTPAEIMNIIEKKAEKFHVDDKELEQIINKLIKQYPKAVKEYKTGKTGVLMFLIGQVMKTLKGKGDALVIRKFLEKALQ